MVYFCKSYRDYGEVVKTVLFNNYDDAMDWARENSGGDRDIAYHVAVYYIEFGDPFDVFHPGDPIEVLHSN
jgi:hypothetical protein